MALRVGILGGMGPAATADFYAKLVAATPATKDQDHLPVSRALASESSRPPARFQRSCTRMRSPAITLIR